METERARSELIDLLSLEIARDAQKPSTLSKSGLNTLYLRSPFPSPQSQMQATHKLLFSAVNPLCIALCFFALAISLSTNSRGILCKTDEIRRRKEKSTFVVHERTLFIPTTRNKSRKLLPCDWNVAFQRRACIDITLSSIALLL